MERRATMGSTPLKIGILHLTCNSVAQTLAEARLIDRMGFDTLWLAEAYPWWRKHGGLEPRSSTALSAVVASRTDRVTIGWGIISPYARHPLQVAAEARVTQEIAGSGRFILGVGASKILMRAIDEGSRRPARPRTAVRELIEIVRPMLAGKEVDFHGKEFTAMAPPMSADTQAPTHDVPVYIGATGPRLQELAGEIADGLLTPSLTTPAFTSYACGNMARGAALAGRETSAIDIGSTLVASIDEHDSGRGRQGARKIVGTYLANKVQNIQGSADVLLECAGLTREELQPIANALDWGGQQAVGREVTDEILDKVVPVAGTPRDCIAALEKHVEAGCTNIMLEISGNQRHRQLDLFNRLVLPHFR
jgi:5,10-methylenetetrahydromethanopterin reductase